MCTVYMIMVFLVPDGYNGNALDMPDIHYLLIAVLLSLAPRNATQPERCMLSHARLSTHHLVHMGIADLDLASRIAFPLSPAIP